MPQLRMLHAHTGARMSPADVRFGIYLTIEEMEAIARELDTHDDCGEGCPVWSATQRITTAARHAREAIGA